MARWIRFCRVGSKHWEIARNERELRAKLNGELATIEMPAKPPAVRLWRRFRPPRPIKLGVTQ